MENCRNQLIPKSNQSNQPSKMLIDSDTLFDQLAIYVFEGSNNSNLQANFTTPDGLISKDNTEFEDLLQNRSRIRKN